MQNNQFKLVIVGLFLLLSGYYLYPTLRDYLHNRTISKMEVAEQEEYAAENFASIASAKERALKLGLDLRGGMLVTLEVRVSALIRALAEDTDATFDEVLAAATERTATEQTTYIDAFLEEFEARDPDFRLSRYFRNTDRGLTRRSDNGEIVSYLTSEASDAVDRAIEIIRQRVDRFGVSEPSIQKQGTRRIIVELPGVEDAERVRDLLRGTARLEFRLLADPNEVNNASQAVLAHYDALAAGTQVDSTVADSSQVVDPIADADSSAIDFLANAGTDEEIANPLLRVFQPVFGGVRIGYAAESDTAEARAILMAPEVADFWPDEMVISWSAAPVGQTEDGEDLHEALALRRDIEMEGDVVVDATPEFDQFTNEPQVSMTMNSEGTRLWARLTGANVGKPVAIMMDGVTFSYPRINEKIPFGRTSISGLESQEEAQDLVTLLKSGALPAPVDIVAERTVGPSLGAESIRAGTMSLIIGVLIVCVFMFLYYRTAGLIANLALFLNVIFIFGILAGFNATLTLPGIAGIVLTIGMAVDANVLIFERIREEQTTGKTMRASIAGGYANALSAILDANITTFLVAAILFSFGKGPIQGFAVTLMAGIVASLFTAIVVTRIVFDWLVGEKRRTVSIG